MKQKTADLLSICLKAGKAVKGFDSVCDAVKTGKASGVLAACDASERTMKEVSFFCEKYSIPLMKTPLSKDELGLICRKPTAVIAVCDAGFCGGFKKILT